MKREYITAIAGIAVFVLIVFIFVYFEDDIRPTVRFAAAMCTLTFLCAYRLFRNNAFRMLRIHMIICVILSGVYIWSVLNHQPDTGLYMYFLLLIEFALIYLIVFPVLKDLQKTGMTDMRGPLIIFLNSLGRWIFLGLGCGFCCGCILMAPYSVFIIFQEPYGLGGFFFISAWGGGVGAVIGLIHGILSAWPLRYASIPMALKYLSIGTLAGGSIAILPGFGWLIAMITGPFGYWIAMYKLHLDGHLAPPSSEPEPESHSETPELPELTSYGT